MPTNPAPTSVVWIVDACRLSRKVACQRLESLGASVVCFENAPTAISEFSRVCMAGRKPDLVLVDLDLPLMRGDAAVRTLRGMGCMAGVLLLAAEVDAEARDAARRCGASGVVRKPVDETAVRGVLRAAA